MKKLLFAIVFSSAVFFNCSPTDDASDIKDPRSPDATEIVETESVEGEARS